METATKGETPTDLKAVENATKVEPPVHRVGGKDTNTHRVGEEAIKVGVSVGFLVVGSVRRSGGSYRSGSASQGSGSGRSSGGFFSKSSKGFFSKSKLSKGSKSGFFSKGTRKSKSKTSKGFFFKSKSSSSKGMHYHWFLFAKSACFFPFAMLTHAIFIFKRIRYW